LAYSSLKILPPKYVSQFKPTVNVHKRAPATTPAADLNNLISSLSIDSFLDPIEMRSEEKEFKNEMEDSLEKNNQQNVSTVDLTKTLPARSNKKRVSVTRSFSYNIGRLPGSKNGKQNSNDLNVVPKIEENNLAKKKTVNTSNDPIKGLDSPTSPVRSSKKSSLTSINDITGKAKSYAETTNFKLANTSNPTANGNLNNMQGSLSQNFLSNNHYNLNSKSSDKIYSIAGTINSATANSTSAVNTLNKINQNESLFGKVQYFEFNIKKFFLSKNLNEQT